MSLPELPRGARFQASVTQARTRLSTRVSLPRAICSIIGIAGVAVNGLNAKRIPAARIRGPGSAASQKASAPRSRSRANATWSVNPAENHNRVDMG